MSIDSINSGDDESVTNNQVIQGNCITEMAKISSDSIDLVIADPPYNLSGGSGLEFDGTWENDDGGEYKGEWKTVDEDWDDMSDKEYSQFSNRWLSELHRVLKPNGSLFIFGTYHHVNEVLSVADSFEVLNEIIWYKRDAMPNVTCSRVTASHENVYWMTPDNDHGYYFDYDEAKRIGLSDDRLNEKDKQLRSVWDIPKTKLGAEKEVGHPTQKPLKLMEPIIRIWSKPGDVVLDPFSGSGSSLVASNINDRQYIGIEMDSEWVEKSRDFISRVSEKPEKVSKISE